MNAQATRRGVPAVALWGGVGALAWAAITVLTGGSSAHADEQSDPSLLSGVGSLVTQTVTTVGDTVTAVTQPVVTEVVAPVVTQVVAPVVTHVTAPVQQAVTPVVETVSEVPVVGPAAAPVVEVVADTAQDVVAPVAGLLQDAPVSQIIAPVQGVVAAVPLIGSLVDQLGVNTIVTSLVGVLDDTTAIVGGVVENTVPPVLEALTPSIADSAEPGVAVAATSPGGAALRATTPPSISALQGTALSAHPSAASSTGPATSVPFVVNGSSAPPVPGGPAPVSSVGSGGASALSHARTSDVGFSPLRAVERTSGASDDVLPTSLVADTDVSPD